MAHRKPWMTAERVEQDRGILERTAADAEVASRDPKLVKLCAEILATGDSHKIVNFASYVRMVRSIWAQEEWDKARAADVTRANDNDSVQNDEPRVAPIAKGFFVSGQELTVEKIGQLCEMLTGKKPGPDETAIIQDLVRELRARRSSGDASPTEHES